MQLVCLARLSTRSADHHDTRRAAGCAPQCAALHSSSLLCQLVRRLPQALVVGIRHRWHACSRRGRHGATARHPGKSRTSTSAALPKLAKHVAPRFGLSTVHAVQKFACVCVRVSAEPGVLLTWRIEPGVPVNALHRLAALKVLQEECLEVVAGQGSARKALQGRRNNRGAGGGAGSGTRSWRRVLPCWRHMPTQRQRVRTWAARCSATGAHCCGGSAQGRGVPARTA